MTLVIVYFVIWFNGIKSRINIENMNFPCKPDHNGECLICDCWLDNCAWQRLQNKDFTYESEDELNKMFKDWRHPTQSEGTPDKGGTALS